MVSTEATFSNITGLQTATLLKKKQKILFFNCNLIKKRDSGTGVFLSILQSF